MKKNFYSEWKTLGLIIIIGYSGIVGISFLSDQNLINIIEGLTILTLGYGFIFFLVKKTRVSISEKKLKFINLFFYRKTIFLERIVEISKQPIYIAASKTFETLYIFYLDKHDHVKWIGLRNAVFSKESMIGIIKEIIRLNPSVRLDKACQKMLDKTKNN